MSCLMNVILASTFLCSLWGEAAAQGAEVKSIDNAEQFALLCRIYNVAKNPPINHVDLTDPNKIVEDIDSINASLPEEKHINETEKLENSSDAHVKHSTTRDAAVAQALLSRITRKAHTIPDKIRKVNATRDIEKVKAEFPQVIFGDNGNEGQLCGGALRGVNERDRAKACGDKGLSTKGASAGKKLVVDFFCLCAMRMDSNQEGIDNVCGVYVGSGKKKGNHGWSTVCPSTSSTMWASIKKECGNLLHQHPKSTAEGHGVVDDFLRHLKSGGVYRWGENGKESDRKAGMLGTSLGEKGNNGNDLICDGSKGNNKGTPPGGVCVYYGHGKWNDNINWLKQFKAALATVEDANNQTVSIQLDIQKLQMLQHRAEEIYETTKAISGIQKPIGLTAFPNATTKRLTSYNAAWRYHPHAHFILPWVLLL
ncbi:Variant surface glycoprotein [Trypanosoma congolense IL3000]|uniref:Variant surface glycoprotein n=1 Tax=Trypanosoma congolense (strain IL3000) TaxID=1068625 RepID=F9WG60_TRYCI|nr:Variant surface glycoprotein [Trypanosoma congolense IL3000]